MKNIILKIFTILTLVLLQTSAFCDDPSGPGSGSSNGIIQAIKDLHRATINALHGEDDNSIVKVLNKIFIADPSSTGSNKSSNNQSIIDKKIDVYVQQFYDLYTTSNFTNQTVEIGNETEINQTGNYDHASSNNSSNSTVTDLLVIERKMKHGVKKQLKREIYYDTQKTLLDKIKDISALLLIKAEGGDNNINNSTFSNNESLKSMFTGGSPYGVFDDSINVTGNNTATQNILDVNALIGPDSYSKEEGNMANNAKMYINQLIQSSPGPRMFSFPQATDSDGNMTLYLPYADTTVTPNTPYKKITGISTQLPIKSCLLGSDCKSTYQRMLDMLSANAIYQQYKVKTRSAIALRTLYFDGLFRIFQERYKEKETDMSLLEKEKYMALSGLTQTYYNNLKTKSVADINLEMLHTLNKVVYFLYKLHQDNQRAQLITSVTGIQAQPADIQDESKYIKPIGALIENGCWVPSSRYNDEPAPNGANADTRKTACGS